MRKVFLSVGCHLTLAGAAPSSAPTRPASTRSTRSSNNGAATARWLTSNSTAPTQQAERELPGLVTQDAPNRPQRHQHSRGRHIGVTSGASVAYETRSCPFAPTRETADRAARSISSGLPDGLTTQTDVSLLYFYM